MDASPIQGVWREVWDRRIEIYWWCHWKLGGLTVKQIAVHFRDLPLGRVLMEKVTRVKISHQNSKPNDLAQHYAQVLYQLLKKVVWPVCSRASGLGKPVGNAAMYSCNERLPSTARTYIARHSSVLSFSVPLKHIFQTTFQWPSKLSRTSP